MAFQEHDHLTRSVLELGDPDALYRVRPARFLAKLGIGVSLLGFGAVGNYYWWNHGPATFGHIELFILIILPLMGATLLWHMYRNRGLHVLLYRTGLLRLIRGEVDSFPWAEIETVHLKVPNAAEPSFERHADGKMAACWLPADVPVFQIWNATLTITRNDGVQVQLGPALSDYGRLAEEVQRRSFAALWPVVWAHFQSGHPLLFDDLEVSSVGLTADKKFLPWRRFGEAVVSQGKLSIKQSDKWLPWRLREIGNVPNPHVLFALLMEAKREMNHRVAENTEGRDAEEIREKSGFE
jgi:hypothetical protein